MTVFLLAGPVCAGKNAALDAVKDSTIEASTVDMGSVARTIYADQDTEESVSDWAGRLKEEEGPEWLAERIVDLWDLGIADTIVISGIRSPAEIRTFRQYGRTETFFIWSDVYTRYYRNEKRSDRAMPPEEFFSRDLKEWEWGLDDILENELYDLFLLNQGISLEQFESAVVQAIDTENYKNYVPQAVKAPWHTNS